MHRSTAILAGALLALVTAPALAAGPISVGLGGGVVVPVSDARHAFDNGFDGHGFVRLNLPVLPIQPRLDFVFQKLDVKDVSVVAPDFTPGTYTGGDQQIVSGLAHLQFNLIKAGPVQPYLVAGVGVSSLRTSLDQAGGESVSKSTTKLTVDGGGGLTVHLGVLSAFVEGRVANVTNDGKVIDFDSITTVPVSFGIVL